MTIKCLYCNSVKVSAIINDEKAALQDLTFRLQRHLTVKHPEEYKEIQKNITVGANLILAFLTMDNTIDITSPETSQDVRSRYEEVQEEVIELLGLTENEEDEEDEEDVKGKEDEDIIEGIIDSPYPV